MLAAIALVAVAASLVSAQPAPVPPPDRQQVPPAPVPYGNNPTPLPPAPTSVARTGVMAGGSVGPGIMRISEFEEDGHGSFALSAFFGGMLSQRLAILVELGITTYTVDEDSPVTVTQSTIVFGARYWAGPRLWLKAGLGRASLKVDYGDRFEEDPVKGTAFVGAVGYELLQRGRFVLEGQLRVDLGSYPSDFDDGRTSVIAAQLGVSWY